MTETNEELEKLIQDMLGILKKGYCIVPAKGLAGSELLEKAIVIAVERNLIVQDGYQGDDNLPRFVMVTPKQTHIIENILH